MANLVAVLLVAVGTIIADFLQSNTRGCRAPRLANVRPRIQAFPIHKHLAKKYLSVRMREGRHKFWFSNIATYIPPPPTVWEMHASSLPQYQATVHFFRL